MSAFITIATLHLLAVMSPGPDFAMILKNSVSYERNRVILTAFGIAFGILVHVFYSIFGLALVISKSILLFNVIKYIGVAYLVYVGFQAMRAKRPSEEEMKLQTKKEISKLKAFQQGFWCNALNPKATLFFLSIFTLVVQPGTSITVQMLYGLEMFLATFLWFSFLGYVLTHRHVQSKIKSFQHYITKAMGGVLLLLGVKIALD